MLSKPCKVRCDHSLIAFYDIKDLTHYDTEKIARISVKSLKIVCPHPRVSIQSCKKNTI